MTATALAGGYVADALVGDPRRLHPVAGFGALAQRAEAAAYAPRRARGVAYAGLLVGGAGAAGVLAGRVAGRSRVLALVTWASLGGRSLRRQAGRLAEQLDAGDLAGARETLPWLCGRDPHALDAAGLSRAALESVAENTSDAVVGALFWGAVAGPGGAVAYRAANTLDAMVGRRDDRYREFGWAAARLDDALNWLPARLTAALTALCSGRPGATWAIVRRDGARHPSPNAGQVEAAFAGALGVKLGGSLSYHGVTELRPELGDGPAPGLEDVRRAVRLSRQVGAAALAVCAGLAVGRTSFAGRTGELAVGRAPSAGRTRRLVGRRR